MPQAKKTPKQADTWRNRIVSYAEVDPRTLIPHNLNWRLHPQMQEDVLKGIIEDVGFVQDIIVTERGTILDGHLRVALAIKENQATIPVKYVDVNEDEEALILTTLDPVAAMVEADADRLKLLIEQTSSGSAAVQQMLSDLADRAGIVPDFEPVGIDEQGKLDELSGKSVECPECGHVFTP